MNKLSNEAKIGLIVLISMIVVFLGFKIMEDQPFFSSSNLLYAKYDTVKGLLKGGPVTMKGIKLGTVKEIRFLPEEDSILVTLNITEDIEIPVGSKAMLVTPLALGSSSIEIIRSERKERLEWEGYLKGVREAGLLEGLSDKGASMADSVSVSINKLNRVLSKAEQLKEEDINATISSFKETSKQVQELITRRQGDIDALILDAQNSMANLSTLSDSSSDDIESMIANMEEFSSKLDALSNELQLSSESINSILSKIDIGEGTIGKMVNDPSLYNNLDSLTINLNELIKGIQEDPRRYLKHMRLVEIF
ncbi:MAG: MlaD family protein [Balneolaceae bacterium]